MNCWKATINKDEEKRDSIAPIKQTEEIDNRQTVYDNELDCITAHDTPSMAMESSQGLWKIK